MFRSKCSLRRVSASSCARSRKAQRLADKADDEDDDHDVDIDIDSDGGFRPNIGQCRSLGHQNRSAVLTDDGRALNHGLIANIAQVTELRTGCVSGIEWCGGGRGRPPR